VGVIVHQQRKVSGLRRDVAKDQEAIRTLQHAVLQREQQAPVPVEVITPVNPDAGALDQRNATIHQLNRELSQANIAARQLQVELTNAQEEHATAQKTADERLQKAQAEGEAELAALQQKLDAALADAQAARQRNIALDAENAKLRGDADEGSTRSAELQRLAANLDDLNRRRDTYLTSLSRRYRDVTSQLRGMSSVLDAGRDPAWMHAGCRGAKSVSPAPAKGI
jgi:chromosome segregation ATPase